MKSKYLHKMVTLQDISVQLMKPAKDLADWKFPLSQILEEYYALLEEPCNINFGEAALVLQNSTNVYVRRVELLCNEAGILKQAFLNYQDNEMQKSVCREKKVSKNSYIDLENFVIIDLESNIGKNIDKKNQFQGQKKVQLISHRFTQLENNVAELCIPFQIYDILGEIIGKKYDFRCNQAVNMNGMLVDELTPDDFTHMPSSRIQKGRHSLSLYSEPKTPVTGTSGYHSAASPNANEFMTPIHEEFEDEHNLSLHIDNDSVLNELEVTEEENICGNNESLSTNNTATIDTTTANNSLSEKCNGKNATENLAINDKYLSNRSSSHTEINKNPRTSSKENPPENECQSSIKNIELSEANDQMTSSSKQIVQDSKSNNVQFKAGLRKRGSQTTKTSICTVDDVNDCDWNPIPLTQGTNSNLSDNVSVLRLPEYISFLETKSSSKKRKLSSRIRKSECLTRFFLRETDSCLKERSFLQQHQTFKHLQKQELDNFLRNLDQCLNNTEKENNSTQYEAVTDVSVDLLGFQISKNKHNPIENNFEETSQSSSSAENKPSSITCNDLHDSEESNMCNDWLEPLPSNINSLYSLPDYQSLIEDKMKKIFAESATEVATELEQTVAKWHASLQPKLSEAEIRPTFRIHDYASRIIETLQSLDQKKVNFDSVVQDKPPCEVARYFLASLQLANTCNVEIKAETGSSNIEIVLLDNKKGNYEES